MMKQSLKIANIPAVSALYYALLQTGYEPFYAMGKDESLREKLAEFRLSAYGADLTFFRDARQTTCEVYPFWPRAAALETATFFINAANGCFEDFDAYQSLILSAPNLSNSERGNEFWSWVKHFPIAPGPVLKSMEFKNYLAWESKHINEQNVLFADKFAIIMDILAKCQAAYQTHVQSVSAVICPIKCANSSDYHVKDSHLFYISGVFREDALLHEYLHIIVHPYVAQHMDVISSLPARYPGIDSSYYLSGDASGQLNAFEEYVVRELSSYLLGGACPPSIATYISKIAESLTL